MRGTLERAPRRLRAPRESHLRVAREARTEDEHSRVSGPNLDTHRARGAHDVRSMEGVLGCSEAGSWPDGEPLVGLIRAHRWRG